ncbi:MAG: GDSL-type esterase/lipase family protein [Firmicutes bacterium]|nr:GDSL-type esterase/lipase family protein [Bacillota bacterium]
MNILCFGDSITYGMGDLEKGGWVNRLRLYIDKKHGYEVDVFNLGRCGEVTQQILNRFDPECQARHVEGKKTVVIFAIGINDTVIIEGEGDRVTDTEFKKNINDLISKAKKFTNEIIFVGLTHVDESLTANRFSDSLQKNKSYLNKRIIQFDGFIQEICTLKSVSYIQMFDVVGKKDLIDGLHPNVDGYEKMFQKINAELTKLDLI